jgi:hypothetical protein
MPAGCGFLQKGMKWHTDVAYMAFADRGTECSMQFCRLCTLCRVAFGFAEMPCLAVSVQALVFVYAGYLCIFQQRVCALVLNVYSTMHAVLFCYND